MRERLERKSAPLRIRGLPPRLAPKPANQRGAAATAKRTKQQTCIELLSRAGGVSIEDLRQATGWQAHSVRGFLAGAVKKKLGLTLVSEKTPDLPRQYRILPVGE